MGLWLKIENPMGEHGPCQRVPSVNPLNSNRWNHQNWTLDKLNKISKVAQPSPEADFVTLDWPTPLS